MLFSLDLVEKIVFVVKYRKHFEENLEILEIFLPMSENIKIQIKYTFIFEKTVFWPYVQKYQLFEENYIILRSLWRSYFFPYIRKYPHFEEKEVLSKKTFFAHTSENIKSLWKNSFLSKCPKINNFFREIALFWTHF